MSLLGTRDQFRGNGLTKPDYIAQMYGYHAVLFEYADLIKETDIAKIEVEDGRVVMTTRAQGIRMVCDRRDMRIAPIEILNFGQYEATDFHMLRQLIGAGGTLFDIGANLGWYALNLVKTIPKLRVDAFEPLPRSFAALRENIALNGADRVHAHNLGFSLREGEAVFYFNGEASGNASLANVADRTAIEQITCQVTTLDQYMRAYGPPADFIKCDVEGAELLVFKGGIKTLQEHKPLVFLEMLRKWSRKFDYHPNETIALFSTCGYRCFTAAPAGLTEFTSMTDSTVETNFFFLHQEKHAEHLRAWTVSG